jgi:predicted transcriptional regulator
MMTKASAAPAHPKAAKHNKPLIALTQESKDKYSKTDPFHRLLKEAGCKLRESRLLLYLLDQEDVKTRPEIQKATGMEQTDVMQSGQALMENGWITITKQQVKEGKSNSGPKFNLYRIAVSREMLCKDLEAVLDAKIKKINAVRDGIRKELGVKKEDTKGSMTPAKPAPVEKPPQPLQSASVEGAAPSGQRLIESDSPPTT